jgi:ATP-dependent RNA helicase DDX23/PRP28
VDVNFILDALPVSNIKPEDEMEVDANSASLTTTSTAKDVANSKYRQTVMFSATMPPAVERYKLKTIGCIFNGLI